MAVYKQCDNCPGLLVVGMFDTITVPKLGADGEPVGGTVQLRLPQHAATAGVPSKFDPTGLVPAPCRHGIPEHPDPDVMASSHARQAVSWVRAKYLDVRRIGPSHPPLPGCPECFGEPRPADLTDRADV